MKILSIHNFTTKLLSDLYIGVHLKGTKKFGNKVTNRQFFHRKTVFHMKILFVINFATNLPRQKSTRFIKNCLEYSTDKRTDVWSRNFIIWKLNSGLWAVVWAGLDCEKKGVGLIMSNFWGLFFNFSGVKKNVEIFLKTL